MGPPCNTIKQYNLKIVWKYHIGTDQGTTTSCVKTTTDIGLGHIALQIAIKYNFIVEGV